MLNQWYPFPPITPPGSKIIHLASTADKSALTWAAEQGVSMSELAQMMGHEDDRTTQKHYARYSPDYLRKVSGAIGRAFSSKGSI